MNVRLPIAWKELLAAEFTKPYFEALARFVRDEYRAAAGGTGEAIYPAAKNVFRAFEQCSLYDLRVVIIGQDPYHGPGQANGLCFSVADGVAHPPSLRNIFKEISSDIGTPVPLSGNLDRWAEQGVLLLNSTLTVRSGQPNSHSAAGWQTFTDAVVTALNDTREQIVYMLWGGFAQRKGQIVDTLRNCVLTAAHPSPLSAHSGFFGCRHFSQANQYLESIGKTPIQW
ncbi:MAG: uracil-DNA glycosylase [Rikenellaceae bacterium]|jgi:uracil-DNA glycosylase|nr:uracil-DNA glycosylase [Rikenellaceae bacterium]